MTTLFLASLAFLITHLGISSTPLRAALIRSIGENAYLGLYSVLAFATLGAMIYGWVNLEETNFIWIPGLAESAIARALMPISFMLVVAGVMAKNPTAVRMEAAVEDESFDGILKITRHPVQWGIFLWAVSHMIANGDAASIVFFGTFAILSGFGTLALDSKYRAREGEGWRRFFDSTSNLPFAAVASGRADLKASELNWLALGIGLVLFVGIYILHGWVSGVALY